MVGNLWAAQPTPVELVKNVSRAALNLNPRAFVDPRHAIRYVATLATRLMQLQGGLIFRAVLVTEPTTESPQQATIRSIA